MAYKSFKIDLKGYTFLGKVKVVMYHRGGI